MKKSVVAAMFLAGLGGAASAATTTLDFTTAAIGTGSTVGNAGGMGYAISTPVGSLTDATHWNTVGCTGDSWEFLCENGDVGFGVTGGLNNEIDSDDLGYREYVVVTFNGLVEVLGFAGMLAYNPDVPILPEDQEDMVGIATSRLVGETVVLEYSQDGGLNWTSSSMAPAVYFTENGTFPTVGLAFLEGLSVMANAVRFSAGGMDDDGSINVTAAGLKISAVPVPASFPLLLAGIGALGFAARRKRRNAA